MATAKKRPPEKRSATHEKKRRQTEQIARLINTGRGRRPDYVPEYAEAAFRLALLGNTDREIARFLGVAEATLYNWKNKYPEFAQRLHDGKTHADARVAEALYRRAVGEAEVVAEKVVVQNGEHVVVPYTERFPPDVSAAIHWLKVRQPELWRERTEMRVGGLPGEPVEMVALTPAEAYARLIAAKKK